MFYLYNEKINKYMDKNVTNTTTILFYGCTFIIWQWIRFIHQSTIQSNHDHKLSQELDFLR